MKNNVRSKATNRWSTILVCSGVLALSLIATQPTQAKADVVSNNTPITTVNSGNQSNQAAVTQSSSTATDTSVSSDANSGSAATTKASTTAPTTTESTSTTEASTTSASEQGTYSSPTTKAGDAATDDYTKTDATSNNTPVTAVVSGLPEGDSDTPATKAVDTLKTAADSTPNMDGALQATVTAADGTYNLSGVDYQVTKDNGSDSYSAAIDSNQTVQLTVTNTDATGAVTTQPVQTMTLADFGQIPIKLMDNTTGIAIKETYTPENKMQTFDSKAVDIDVVAVDGNGNPVNQATPVNGSESNGSVTLKAPTVSGYVISPEYDDVTDADGNITVTAPTDGSNTLTLNYLGQNDTYGDISYTDDPVVNGADAGKTIFKGDTTSSGSPIEFVGGTPDADTGATNYDAVITYDDNQVPVSVTYTTVIQGGGATEKITYDLQNNKVYIHTDYDDGSTQPDREIDLTSEQLATILPDGTKTLVLPAVKTITHNQSVSIFPSQITVKYNKLPQDSGTDTNADNGTTDLKTNVGALSTNSGTLTPETTTNTTSTTPDANGLTTPTSSTTGEPNSNTSNTPAGSTTGELTGEPAGNTSNTPTGSTTGERTGNTSNTPTGSTTGKPTGNTNETPTGSTTGTPTATTPAGQAGTEAAEKAGLNSETLPQTSEATVNPLAAVGASLLAMLAGLFGFKIRERKH